MKKHTTQQDFKGFDDFIELFRAGEHVASDGKKRTWTNDDLDQMVANHSAATAAPIVIGHPKHNDPAFGWIDEIKRDGDSLYAKFRDVNPEFASAVEDGSYRKRSVRIYKTPDNTFAIEHVGFLGAKRPAIALEAMNYNAVEASEVFDFEADWYTPNVIARAMRRMREFFIEQFGVEKADQVLPDYEITSLDNHANDLLRKPELGTPTNPMFNAPTGGTDVTPEDHQKALDAAKAQAKEEARAEFAAQQTALQQQLDEANRKNKGAEFTAFKQELIDAGHAPAKLEGMVEFMHHLDKGEATEFEFSAADGTQKKLDPVKWFREFAAAQSPAVKLGQNEGGEPASGQQADFTAPQGYGVDTSQLELRDKALAYQAANPGVDFITACKAVDKQ